VSPEAQRIAIAKVCGWVPTPLGNWTKNPTGIPAKDFPFLIAPPNYLSDLNAMHEAEKTLTDALHKSFREKLWHVIPCHTFNDYRLWISATAAQRAEAFLKTLGKWEEQPAPATKGAQ
jgi:uncharacterized protein HemY